MAPDDDVRGHRPENRRNRAQDAGAVRQRSTTISRRARHERARAEPKHQDLAGAEYAHLDDAVQKPETVKDGYVSLGRAARHQAEAGEGTGPNPSRPKGSETPQA